MAGVRVTKDTEPTNHDNDENGFVLAFSPMPRPSNLNSRGLSGRGWARVKAQLVRDNHIVYKYWIPLRDLKLMPMHPVHICEESENSCPACEEETMPP